MSTVQTEPTTDDQAKPEAKPQEPAPDNAGSNEPPKDDENNLPEWARNKLTKANSEAASYRTQLRDAQTALSKAKTSEEFDAVVQEFNSKLAAAELNTAKTTAALKYNLPETLVVRLQGTTPEELDADAKALSELVQNAPNNGERLRGGLNPAGNTEPERYDPKKLAAEVNKGYGLWQ